MTENGPKDAESATVAGSTVADDNEASAIFAATEGRGQISHLFVAFCTSRASYSSVVDLELQPIARHYRLWPLNQVNIYPTLLCATANHCLQK